VRLWRTSKGDGVPLVRALTATSDLKGSNEEQDHGIVIAMRAMRPRWSSPQPAERRQRLGRSLRDLLGRSLCDNDSGLAFAGSSTCVLDPRVRPPWRAATLNF